jgi:hypothetical protein
MLLDNPGGDGGDRLPMEEIFGIVMSGATLSVNYHVMLSSAAVIAGLGLGTSSAVMVVARSHCRFKQPLIQFTPDLQTYSVRLYLK